MSIMPKQSIQSVAQTIGIANLGEEVASALASDVEYRLREIIQEAIKCMRHSKRSVLTTDDVNNALSLRHVEPLYGFVSTDPLRFRRAFGHSDLYFIDDRELELKEIFESKLPKVPLETSVSAHWLAINGVQPAIPENASVSLTTASEDVSKQVHPSSSEKSMVEIKPAIKHVLSKELQLYFEKITELIILEKNEKSISTALYSLSTDPGIHPLLIYFTHFIADEVTNYFHKDEGDDNFFLLFNLMRVIKCLFINPHVNMEPYLHQLMPSVITCLVAKKIQKNYFHHWQLRDFSSNILAYICRRFGASYPTLQARVSKTLLETFLNSKRSFAQHYGALKGLSSLGNNVVKLLILPNLGPYLQVLTPELDPKSQTKSKSIKSFEASKVFYTLQGIVGNCLCEQIKNSNEVVFNIRFQNILSSKSKMNKSSIPSFPMNRMERDKKESKLGNENENEKESESETNNLILIKDSIGREEKNQEEMEESDKNPASINIEDEEIGNRTKTVASSLTKQIASVGSKRSIHEVEGNESVEEKENGDGERERKEDESIVLQKDAEDEKLFLPLFEWFGEGILPYVPLPELYIFI